MICCSEPTLTFMSPMSYDFFWAFTDLRKSPTLKKKCLAESKKVLNCKAETTFIPKKNCNQRLLSNFPDFSWVHFFRNTYIKLSFLRACQIWEFGFVNVTNGAVAVARVSLYGI